MEQRYYLVIDAGEFIGTFIVYSARSREQVECYRDALMRPHGIKQEWGPGVNIVDRSCWYAWWPDALRRYEEARDLVR